MLPPWLRDLADAVREVDPAAAAEARRCFDEKTKPVGSLGRIEEIGVRLAAIHRQLDFETTPRAVVVMAADHGVVRRSVSAYPQEVTAQMVRNFAAGGAAINVLARQTETRTVIVDMGVAGPQVWSRDVRACAVAPGTADMTLGPAMSAGEAEQALRCGAELARELGREGIRLLATGDMGIGNTTAAAALTAVFTGRPPAEVTGRGTGIDDASLARKIAAVELALAANQPLADRPLEALAKVGGFEIAGLAGLILGGAASGVPVVLDGFIAGAAALVATALCATAGRYLFAGHRSSEAGHGAVLAHLGLQPILDLGLRLGEGTGAVLALPVLDAARNLVREMASFESAGVSRCDPL